MKKSKNSTLSFGEIRNMLETLSDKSFIIVDDNNKEQKFIDTGIYILNALLAKSILNGGIPSNRFTIFAGEESVGKSYLCYNIARSAQKMGYNVIFIDTEYSTDYQLFESFGIDTSKEKFILLRTNKIEELKIILAKLIENLKEQKRNGNEFDKFIIFIDSIGQLASSKEIEDAVEGKNKADMSRAKAIKSLFRIITSDLGYLDIPLVATNHIYMTQDFYPTAVQSGGKGLDYSASIIVYLNKSKLKTGNEDELDISSGIVVTAISRKNRIAKPKKIKFEINNDYGTNKYKGLEFFCTIENFDKVGIAKVKKEIDKKTGEIKYVPNLNGNKWYVKHLDKYLFEKQLFNSVVFNDEVLKELDKIIYEYFSYSSNEEIEQIEKEMNNLFNDLEIDNEDDSKYENDFLLDKN